MITVIDAHTLRAIQQAECLGGWRALPKRDLFAMEYWDLEQAKLRKMGTPPPYAGKVALQLVLPAVSWPGLRQVQGTAVMALDIDPTVEARFMAANFRGSRFSLVCRSG